MSNEKKQVVQTAGRTELGEVAPTFAAINDDVLFGEIWNRQEELSLHDRSVVTVVALLAQGLTDSSFKYHLISAKNHGVTLQEMSEIITHAAFYVGWPKAWAAFHLIKDVWSEDSVMSREEFECVTDYPIGVSNDAYAKYFIGKSYLAPLNADQGGPVNVTFEPGCRNNWHIHHDQVQVLICVAGRGWYQEAGKEAQPMTPGMVITIPIGVKHWHGAAKNSWFQHLTYHTQMGKNPSNEWLEVVSDELYNCLK